MLKPFYLATFISAFVLLFANVKAQSDFSDADYFLVDSLNYIALSGEDSALILSTAKKYHAAQHDTSKLAFVEELVDACWNDAVWPRYNLFMLKKATELAEQAEINSPEWRRYLYYQGSGNGGIGHQFDVVGNTDSATVYYLKALDYFERGNHPQGESLIYDALAMIYELKGDMRRAIDVYNKALQIAEENQDSLAIANVAVSLGDLHGQLQNFELSKKYYLLTMEAARASGQKRIEGFAYTSIATDYYDNYQLDSAKILTRIGLKVLDESGYQHAKGNGYNMLGNIAMFENDLDSARYFFQKMLTISTQNRQPEDAIMARSNLSRVEALANNYQQAKQHALVGYKTAKSNGFPSLISRTSKDLAKVFEAEQQLDSAYKYLLEYTTLNDSIKNVSLKNQALKQAIQYDYEKQQAVERAEHEAELAIAEEREFRQRITIWGAIAILLLISLALVSNFFRLKTIKKQKAKLDIAYQELELRKNDKILASNLKALQAQMNPHFIFNALNSIQTLVLHGNVDASYDYINQFALLIRETLNSSEQEFIPIEKEIETLETYLKLEKLRFREDFNYHIEVTEQVPNQYLPPMLIQPFIENALKHGLFHKKTDRKLRVEMNFNENVLICKIEDNGIGREASKKLNARKNKEHKSFAISSINKRLSMMQEKLKTPIGVEYHDLNEDGIPTGTLVIIRIPLYNHSSNKSDQS